MESGSWFSLFISSSTIASILSITATMGWNVWQRKIQVKESAAARLNRVNHARLSLAFGLEDFMTQCCDLREKILVDTMFVPASEWPAPHNDMRAYQCPIFEFPEGIDWVDFSLEEAAELREFPRRMIEVRGWIVDDYYDGDQDADNYLGYIKQHCAYFGLAAWELSIRQRAALGAPANGVGPSSHQEWCLSRLQEEIDTRRKLVEKHGYTIGLIPPLRKDLGADSLPLRPAQLKRERQPAPSSSFKDRLSDHHWRIAAAVCASRRAFVT
ncbi:hypothetical protein [Paraburkholderia sp.]|uniref:hypothetical protein n=1 Tax=Paraburkholderia sp. TaxID=1926495 RepID=UPI0039E2BFE8